MAEYIERGVAIAKLTALEVAESNATMADARRLLADMPAADVAPVVHGKWLDEDFPEKMATVHEMAICSACRELSHKAEHGYSILSDYCPHCGAKMDMGESEK